eukprot:SAG11_NODE_27785_length_329_cov_0.604348_2_plen_21_part_01
MRGWTGACVDGPAEPADGGLT